MSVIVDTSVWSLALRRRASARTTVKQAEIVKELVKLIDKSSALIVGPVRQELLSGLSFKDQFQKLREILRAFPEVIVVGDDYENAAELSNLARAKGIQSTPVDSLIWAIAVRTEFSIFTLDSDFQRLSRIAHIKLWKAQSG